MKNEWKDLLNEAFYAPEPQNKQAFLKNLRPRKVSTFEMLLEQVRYIRLSVWIMAIAIIAFAISGSIMHVEETEELIPVIMPFLAGVSVLETGKSRKCGMTELEMVTRFSLRSVIFARMLILGILYLLILCITSPVIAAAFGGKTVATAVHILIPYLVTMSISLMIERSKWGRKSEYTSLAVSSLISLFTIWTQSYDPTMVRKYAEAIDNWGILIVILLATTTVFEQYKTINYMEELA